MEGSQQKNIMPIPQEMQEALNSFDRDASDIVDRWLSKLESCPAPPEIYHYTADVGLRGILKSGKLLLTDIFALNDPSELRHGFKLATDILDERVKNRPAECTEFAKHFKTALNKRFEEVAYYFVCSFSACRDDLGQWRAYADNGCGYALGFNTEPLEKHLCQHARTSTSDGGAFPITYDDDQLSHLHGEIIEKVLPLISLPSGKKLSRDDMKSYWSQLLTNLAKHVLHANIYFKHEAYRNEREYRFFDLHRADAPPTVKFRPRGYELIKYREFDWKSAGEGVLEKIVIGPAADFEKSKRFAEACLRESGIDVASVEITRSNIPYRPA